MISEDQLFSLLCTAEDDTLLGSAIYIISVGYVMHIISLAISTQASPGKGDFGIFLLLIFFFLK